MAGYARAKKLILLVVFLTIHSLLSLIPTGCKNETPVYAIVGQQLAIIRQGRYDSAMLELKFELRQIGIAKVPQHHGGELFATTPAPPIIRNEITKISITAEGSYDAGHPAFSELNGLFALRENPTAPIANLIPPITVDDRRAVYIIPIAPPANENLFRLTATTTLEDGTKLTSTTNIEIRP